MNSMIRRLIISTIVLLAALPAMNASAQSYALIDMQYITTKHTKYSKVVQSIQQSSEQYTKEINEIEQEIRQMYIAYQKEADQLSQQEKVAREKAILSKEQDLQQKRQKYFGPEGVLAKRQENELKPLDNLIYEAVKEISREEGYDIVFDRAAAQGIIIFANPAIDISNAVLRRLGYSTK